MYIFFVYNYVYSQECIVISEALKGKYEGGCEKGKAHGNGKAIGMDSYEGEFRNGFPDGKGMYIWKDGHYFIGRYKKGIKEGRGTCTSKVQQEKIQSSAVIGKKIYMKDFMKNHMKLWL